MTFMFFGTIKTAMVTMVRDTGCSTGGYRLGQSPTL